VFVPLRAYIEENQSGDASPDSMSADVADMQEKKGAQKRIVRQFEALDDWVARTDHHDAIRIVSGGPGIGKSSSMRGFAARLARSEHVYPVLIPLQKLEKADQPLDDRVGHYLENSRHFRNKKSPLNTGDLARPVLLLIFDGLDELVRPGKDADEIARDFMIDLRRLLEIKNGSRGPPAVKVLAVVTGRISYEI
jgi:hypothetical protein